MRRATFDLGLTLNKFHGDPKVWNEWWDSYKCAVHDNTQISEVEKFNYLRSLLQGVAASSIAGLQLTAVNYSVALKLLKERFAQEQTITNAHMDALLKLKGTTSTSEVNKIREVYDGIEIQVRGLQAVGVKSEQYGTLLIPIIMSKIQEELVLILSRQISKENWNLDEILQQLKAELEARERCANAAIKENSKEVNTKPNGGRWNRNSAAALTAQDFKVTCTYCK